MPFTSQTSYAQALKSDPAQIENATNINNVQQQPNDMAQLKAMMKTLIEQMSTMMTSKICLNVQHNYSGMECQWYATAHP